MWQYSHRHIYHTVCRQVNFCTSHDPQWFIYFYYYYSYCVSQRRCSSAPISERHGISVRPFTHPVIITRRPRHIVMRCDVYESSPTLLFLRLTPHSTSRIQFIIHKTKQQRLNFRLFAAINEVRGGERLQHMQRKNTRRGICIRRRADYQIMAYLLGSSVRCQVQSGSLIISKLLHIFPVSQVSPRMLTEPSHSIANLKETD